MSFTKIKDPRKREELIKDLIETRKRIKDNFIAKKVGEAEYQTGLTKLFKPVTETQKATAKEITEAQKATAEKITSELIPIREGLENITVIPPIEAGEEKKAIQLTDPLTEEEKINLGPIAEKFLKTPWNNESLDLNFGLNTKNKEKKYQIGDELVTFKGDNIEVKGTTYIGTPGFWALIVSKRPAPGDYDDEDLKKYKKFLIETNAVYLDNDPTKNKPKGNYQGPKWKNIINPIWQEIKLKPTGKGGKGKGGKGKGGKGKEGKGDPQPGTSGTGLKFLSSDPNALIDRFDLLFSSQKAGHTGVRNEIISILDQLKRQGVIKTNEYKKLNSLIKK